MGGERGSVNVGGEKTNHKKRNEKILNEVHGKKGVPALAMVGLLSSSIR